MIYTPHPQHRDFNFSSKKSQWRIEIENEIKAYQYAVNKVWINEGAYWGLHIVNQCPAVLGITPLPEKKELKIAKFVGKNGTEWHGYPVAHWLSPWDKPHQSILQAWLEEGLIKKPTFSKIHRGKQCDL